MGVLRSTQAFKVSFYNPAEVDEMYCAETHPTEVQMKIGQKNDREVFIWQN